MSHARMHAHTHTRTHARTHTNLHSCTLRSLRLAHNQSGRRHARHIARHHLYQGKTITICRQVVCEGKQRVCGLGRRRGYVSVSAPRRVQVASAVRDCTVQYVTVHVHGAGNTGRWRSSHAGKRCLQRLAGRGFGMDGFSLHLSAGSLSLPSPAPHPPTPPPPLALSEFLSPSVSH